MDQDTPQVTEEELVRHKVARVQDDLGQKEVEEGPRREIERLGLVCAPDDSTQDPAEADEQSALGDNAGHMGVGPDDCKHTKK